MAKNIRQASSSFIISAIVCLLLVLVVCWIGVLMLAIHPNIESNQVVKRIISDYSFIVGYKGIVLAGIMAMVMSTVDSFINSTSVIFVHDFLKPLKVKFVENELISARIMSLLIGTLSLILSLREGSILELVIITYSLYMPIVTVPFITAILGFRSTGKSVLLGMGAGFTTIIVWDYLLQIKTVNSIPFGMIANLIVLMGSHYLLQQDGGWVGIKDQAPLIAIRNERKLRVKSLLHNLKTFNLIDLCKKNRPTGDGLISILGIFVMISAFASTHTLGKQYQLQYKHIIDILYPLTLCSSTALISYPLWLQKWKKAEAIGIVWNVIMFTVLICFSFLMVLISDFSEIQLMVFMVNIIMLSSLITWRWALITITLGIAITAFYYQHISVEVQQNMLSLQFKIVYLLLLVTSTLVAFLRPKQAYQELTEEQNVHLNCQIVAKTQEVQEALALKGEFIRNMNHEYHAPMTGVISMAEGLQAGYDRLSDKQKKQAIDIIVKSAHSLRVFDENLATLHELSKPNYKLNKEDINFSDLVYDRIQTCRRLYEENKEDREFILNIADDIIINADRNYMIQLLDNLIINSISYCKKGKITITLDKYKTGIDLTIADEGIGIPLAEIYDIFKPFTVSSRTRTPAGGRGVGLAICHFILEAHGGTITAESDGIKGATFRVILKQS